MPKLELATFPIERSALDETTSMSETAQTPATVHDDDGFEFVIPDGGETLAMFPMLVCASDACPISSIERKAKTRPKLSATLAAPTNNPRTRTKRQPALKYEHKHGMYLRPTYYRPSKLLSPINPGKV